MPKVLKVSTVAQNQQGQQIGIQAGDALISYDGVPLSTNLALSNAVYNAQQNGKDAITVTIVRHGAELNLTANPQEKLGIDCYEFDMEQRTTPPLEAEFQHVVVHDIRMSFGAMVAFMVKWVLASIPALLILVIIFAILSAIFGGIVGGMMGAF